MVTSSTLRMSEAEYLRYDLEHEGKHEYVNGEVIAMAGATLAHSTVQGNAYSSLRTRLKGSACQVHGPDLRVRISETGLYAYPDVVVYCGEPQFAPTRPETLLNPSLLVEVLSASTYDYDLGAKRNHYRRRPTVHSIVMVSSNERYVQVETRNDDGTWTSADLDDGTLRLPALKIEIPLPELYEGWRKPE